jgi:hypothetical protein
MLSYKKINNSNSVKLKRKRKREKETKETRKKWIPLQDFLRLQHQDRWWAHLIIKRLLHFSTSTEHRSKITLNKSEHVHVCVYVCQTSVMRTFARCTRLRSPPERYLIKRS